MKIRSKSSSSRCSSCYTDSTYRSRVNYGSIKRGQQKSIPVAILLWAFRELPSRQGLTSRRVINFIKQHYKVANAPAKTGKAISKMLRCAVEFGLLKKHGNRFYLAKTSYDSDN